MSTKITLGGESIELRPLTSLTDKTDLQVVYQSSQLRAMGAALGLCWPRTPSRPKLSPAQFNYSLAAYGGALIDHLTDSGLPVDEVITAAGEAFRFAIDLPTPTAEEVSAEEGFSAAEEPSTTT